MNGAELRRIRRKLGISQAQLAAEVGVDSNTVARWERDEVLIGTTAQILIQKLDSQRRRSPGSTARGDVVLDEHHRSILHALDEHLDPEVFEQCAVDLIGKTGLRVVPVVGGGDAGFDGSVFDFDTGRPIPLIVTISAKPADNLKKNLRSAKQQDPTLDRAFFATSRSLTPQMRRKLSQVAGHEGVQLMQVYDRTWFAQALYRDPVCCKKLLGVTGRPRALSRFPISSRHIEGNHLVGRDNTIEWLKSQEGDCLLMGVPGSGKTFILSSLVEELDALFLVDNDRERLANDIRELSPKAVIVDDAHTDIRALKSLIQLRSHIDADLRIIATTWPGYDSAVVRELALSESAIHELGLIHADEMIEVIKAHGVYGPPRLLGLIRLQARGRPGLAGTLATLSLAGDFGRILTGDALLEELTPQLVSMIGDGTIVLLGYFALGGNSGAFPEQVAAQTGESRMIIDTRLAGLAAAGIIEPLRDGRVVVVPEAFRLALVKRAFFRDPVGRYHDALEAVANRHDGILTLIRASGRGVLVSDLWDLLREAKSESLWAEYAWLGVREALYVIENELSRYEIVAEQGLRHVPEIMIPILLNQMPEPWPTFGAENHPAVRALREWTVDRGDDFRRDEIALRRILVKATRSWWDKWGRTHQALHVMTLALRPTFSVHELDPGAGTTFTLRSYLHDKSVLKFQMELWEDILNLVKGATVVPWGLLLSLVASWLPDGSKPELEDAAQEMRRFSEKILGDLALVTKERPGIQSKLDHTAKGWGLDIDVLLDPLYEAAFPRVGPFTAEEDNKRAARFVRMVEDLPPSVLADKLVQMSRERDYAGHSSDGFVFLIACQQLAHRVPDLVTFVEDLVTRRAGQELVGSFFQQAAATRPERFGDLVSQLLDNTDYESLAVHHLLVNEDTPPLMVTDALERAERYPSMLIGLAEFGRLNSEATQRLLVGPDEVLATTAAAGYRLRRGVTEGDALYGAWRDAIVRSARTVHIGDAQTGWLIKEILKKNPDLAKDWLLEWMASGRHWLDMHEDCAEVASGMSLEQRRHILERIEHRPVIGIDDIVRQLVGDDLELFAQALKMDNLSDYRASLLAGRPDEMWLKKATMAIEAGLSLGEIAGASYMLPMMWSGEESQMWAGWRQDFERLADRNHDDPRVAKLLLIAIEGVQSREEAARSRESRESVLGFGER